MKNFNSLSMLLALPLITTLSAARITGTFTSYNLSTSDGTRIYYVYVPHVQSVPPSMLVFLHGTYAQPNIPIANKTNWEAISDQYGPIIVWPISTYVTETSSWYWNCQGCGAAFPGGIGPGDESFIAQVIEIVQAQYGISPGYTFVCGMSSGGYMTQAVGDQSSNLVAAIGPVSGAQYIQPPGYVFAPPATSNPMSVYRMNGDEDTVVPYCGATKGFWNRVKAYTPSMDSDLAYWSAQSQCTTFSESLPLCTGGQPTAGVNGQDATGCLSGTEVLFEREVGYGHEWLPGTELKLWTFFAAHER